MQRTQLGQRLCGGARAQIKGTERLTAAESEQVLGQRTYEYSSCPSFAPSIVSRPLNARRFSIVFIRSPSTAHNASKPARLMTCFELSPWASSRSMMELRRLMVARPFRAAVPLPVPASVAPVDAPSSVPFGHASWGLPGSVVPPPFSGEA